MEATSIPRPAPLEGEIMLPFALWPVAELVDGRRNVSGIAASLNLSVATVQSALRSIEREIGQPLTDEAAAPIAAVSNAAPALTSEQVVDILMDTAVELVGPMGEVMVEDALDELGENAPPVELAYRVAQELREPQRSTFIARVRAKGLS